MCQSNVCGAFGQLECRYIRAQKGARKGHSRTVTRITARGCKVGGDYPQLRCPMPILMMALLALLIFLVLLFMFVAAVAAEHRQRNAESEQKEAVAKATANSAGR